MYGISVPISSKPNNINLIMLQLYLHSCVVQTPMKFFFFFAIFSNGFVDLVVWDVFLRSFN